MLIRLVNEDSAPFENSVSDDHKNTTEFDYLQTDMACLAMKRRFSAPWFELARPMMLRKCFRTTL